jgi:acylphosphatase
MVHIIIEGHVQGVGFRQFVKYKAKKLDITGWVKNLPDSRVEALIEGSPENVREMVEVCKKGPYLAQVKKIDVNWNHKLPEEILDFQIIK